MKDHHKSQHLHANLAGTHTRDCCLEQPLQGIYSNDKLMKYLPNVSGIADDILVVGYSSNGKDHDETL